MIKKIFASWYIVVLLLLAGFVVRLYRFDNPIADWHSWRQADTSSVSRNFAEKGFDFLHPTYHDLSNVPTGKYDNPHGYRFVEFPIYNAFQAGPYKIIGIFTLEEWGRLVTIVMSLFSGLFLYFIVRKYADATTAVFSLFFFLFLPYNIYYSRTILPDPSMVAATLGAIYFFDKWIEKVNPKSQKTNLKITRYVFYILAMLFTAAALLLKPFAAFFLLPVVYLVWSNFGFTALKKWELYVYAVLSLLPLILWRLWIVQYPEGIPASDWLFNAGNIRFKGAFFYWLFGDRIGRLILGFWGIGLFVLGTLANSRTSYLKKHGFFFYTFFLSTLLYFSVVARGNVQHDYYQIPIIPSLALFLGLGAGALIHAPQEYINRYVAWAILGVCVLFNLLFGWYFVRDYFNINNPAIVEAGKIVDEKTPKDAKVIALLDGDTSFLYQTKRSGWASYEKSLPELIQMGAQYLVEVNPSENDISSLSSQYQVVASSSSYLLIKLQ